MPYEIDKTENHFRHFDIIDHNRNITANRKSVKLIITLESQFEPQRASEDWEKQVIIQIESPNKMTKQNCPNIKVVGQRFEVDIDIKVVGQRFEDIDFRVLQMIETWRSSLK
jgi:hypothetical protein